MANHFNDVLETIKETPKANRTNALIQGIAKQMAQSNDQQTQQLGQELQQVQSQLVNALQQ